MIDLADIQRIADLAKSYLAQRKKYARLSERAYSMEIGKQTQKANVDLNWQAMELLKIEAALHAACVDAGVADLRETAAYADRELRPSAWHCFHFSPPKPRTGLADQAGANAHLIDAAPELYAMVQALASFASSASTLDFNEDRNIMWAVYAADRAEKLLAKARGEPA